jgi:signal transduction histidine kinase
MRWRIRYQLLVPLLTLLIAVLGTSTWTAFTSVQRARQQIENQVHNVAGVLARSHFPLNSHVLEQTKGLSGAEYVVVGSDGRQVTTLPTETVQLPAVPETPGGWQSLRLGPRVTVAGQSYLCFGLRLEKPRTDRGETLYILYPEAAWRDAVWEALRPSLLLGGLGVVASGALAAGVARRLSRRIQDLEERTRRIAGGDFGPMPLAGYRDELYDLGRSVNDMAEQLAQLQQAVQRNERLRLLGQVSAGLAHQLRNGVTGARLAVQLHARECDSAADREALDVAVRQLDLLELNVKRFLELGRTGSPRWASCQITSVVDEAVLLLRPQCRHVRVELRWRPPDTVVFLQGDVGQLRHLILNVLGNAVEAAGPGGWVEVKMRPADPGLPTGVVIEVRDSGPGPPPEVKGRLFEPFVTGKRDGVGLGLAVARQIAEAHGGSLAYCPEEATTCFRILLPLPAGSEGHAGAGV